MKLTTYLTILLTACVFVGLNAQDISGDAGKIWYSGDQLFVNIAEKGVLVIDNSDPKAPKKKGFIEIPGNVDIAVKDEVLFANNYDDLIAIDISKLKKISNKRILKRFDGIFTQYESSKGKEKIKWIKPKKKKWMASPISIASSSKGGSMACFSLVGNYLYTLTPSAIHTFNVDKPKKIEKSGEPTNIFGDTYETIFSNGENLFVGGQGGMYIFDIDEPTSPTQVGEYQHVQSCDPVVVEGDYAYVTLRNGNVCGRDKEINRLEVVDISNPSNPRKVSTNKMQHPHGLAVDNGILFVCDGDNGLKVLDATNPRDVDRIDTYDDISSTYDVINIPEKKLLILVGGNSVIQYDYTDVNKLKQLSLFRTEL
jgi:hypothetical protein